MADAVDASDASDAVFRRTLSDAVFRRTLPMGIVIAEAPVKLSGTDD